MKIMRSGKQAINCKVACHVKTEVPNMLLNDWNRFVDFCDIDQK